MIRIRKSGAVPAILSAQGLTETNALKAAYAAAPANYTSRAGISNRGITKMAFYNNIYGDALVKEQLIHEQHEKCCFCEGKFLEYSYGDVEHFRPKKAYKKKGARTLTYPGYYWLAYDWNNLLFSCEKCNRKFKKNQFPLDNETTRVPNHTSPNLLADEDRLLINPVEEDPSTFITFVEEVPVAVANNLKGKTSIKAFGLERLNDARLEWLQILKREFVFLNIDETNPVELSGAAATLKITEPDLIDLIIKSRHFFATAALDTAKFAACVRVKFPHLPRV